MRFIVIFGLVLILSINLQAKKKGSPPMASGAPGDRTCNTSKCHATNDLNTDKAKIFIEGLPEVSTPNESYEISLHLEQTGAKKFGFQATVADTQGKALGTLMTVEGQETRHQINPVFLRSSCDGGGPLFRCGRNFPDATARQLSIWAFE